jgi:predicted negative regulator of RcsB-dependent stress response
VNNSTSLGIPVSKKHSKRKKWLIVCVIIIVLLGGGGATAWYFLYGQKPKTSTTNTTKTVNQAVATAVSDAQTLANNGNTTAAAAKYDVAIKSSTDNTQKSIIMSSKATLYFNTGDYNGALVAAKEAEAVDKTKNVESFIGQIYEKMGDKQNAIKYYQNAIALVDKSQPMADSYIDYIQTKIDELSGVGN